MFVSLRGLRELYRRHTEYMANIVRAIHRIETRKLTAKMPVIKLKHIVSFSSEDPNHPADNLLKSETYRKWQCADPPEKQASVIIELEKASKISSVDIGNNGSAFVEILVGRSSSNEYQVLLVASSFMSPAESKSGTNNNRVRMFGTEKLSKAVVDQKWDRVKLICSQPYTKTSCYGLSFVNLHTSESSEKNDKTQTKLGAFLLKDEEVDTIPSGSLFAKRKVKTEGISSQAKSTAVELREASKNPSIASTSSARLNSEPQNSKRKEESMPSLKRKSESPTAKKPAAIPKLSKKENVQPPAKKAKVVETSQNQTREIAINQILKEVVFVLSGFKNPERGNLRDKAISMGARYRGDWDKTCTHLICAFMNTPKYSQVKKNGKGKIVTQKWIHDCHSRRKRLPEKRYKLIGDDSDDGSTTEEEEIKTTADQEPGKDRSTNLQSNDTIVQSLESTSPGEAKTPKKSPSSIVSIETTPDKVYKTYDNEESCEVQDNTEIIEDDSKPDDETRVTKDDEDPYNCSTEFETDEDDDVSKEVNHKTKDKTSPTKSPTVDLLDLPDFFSKMTFFLHGNFTSEDRRMLTRYITAYDGEVKDYMNDSVKYVVTNEDWDDHFDEALFENSSLTFVRPKWIYKCHDKRSFLPFQPYIVVPH